MPRYLKVFLLTFLFLSLCFPAFAATDSEIVNSFKKYIADNMNKVFETYQGNHYQIKSMANIIRDPRTNNNHIKKDYQKIIEHIDSNYSIDIQKTNSLMTPYIGTLEAKKYISFYNSAEDKESAQNMSIKSTSVYILRFRIAYQNEQWVVTEAKFFDNIFWSDVRKDIFEALKCNDTMRN